MSGRTGRRDPPPWRRHLLRLALLGSVFAVPALAEESGIAIAIDGAALDGTPAPAVEPDADIKMTFDGLNVQPRLNVATADLRRTYRAGETVRFSTSSNYPAFIAGAEIRILPFDGKAHGTAPVAVLPVEPNGMAEWVMPDDGPAEFVYVLRVRDAEGHHDETAPLALARGDHEGHATTEPVVAAGEGEDRAARRDIPVFGGAVTVSGRGIAAGDIVTVAGETIPVDGDGRFVTQRILPPGDHRIDVAVAGERTMTASRDIAIPTHDFFYVGLADLTVGRRFGDADLAAANPGEYDRIYTKGRLAFYLKGKIRGRTLLTASLDTGEDDLDTLLRGLDRKDPRHLLARIDPDQFYPVYGDGSTSLDDAPTSGKFYVRLERGDNAIMWGNFRSAIAGAELLRSERALYGASAVHRSAAVTAAGDRRVEAELYAAQPGTLPQRDSFRGTGGSAYFLKRQDITPGSETVTVETRDPVTDRVLSRRRLTAGADYRLDPVQGVILLSRPLASTERDNSAVRDDALGGAVVVLVVQYEYTPTTADVDGFALGGRAQAWLDDHVRLGVTGLREKTGAGAVAADQTMLGADLLLRHSDTTFLSLEYAQTAGPGFGRSSSTDGGLTIDDHGSSGIDGRVARAFRAAGQVDLAEVSGGAISGRAGFHAERRDAGFSTLLLDTPADQRIAGAFVEVSAGEKLTLAGEIEEYRDSLGRRRGTAEAEARFELAEGWALATGVKHTRLADPAGPATSNGSRTEIGARLTRTIDDATSYALFGQAAIGRSGGLENRWRAGIAASRQLTDKIAVDGEISYGTTGLGGLAALAYEPTADDRYYVGYRLDPDAGTARFGGLPALDDGGLVAGARRRYSDALSAFVENRSDLTGRHRSLTTTYGVTYTPDALWSVEAGLEAGRIIDRDSGDFDRKALSFGVVRADTDGIAARLRGEARFEDSDDNLRDRQSYLVAAGLTWAASPDWKMLADFDAVISNSDQAAILDGDYIAASLGFAYRPVEHDRLNALFKYAVLYDLPGPDQVDAGGSTLGPRQRSHVLSADATWQATDRLTLGAKYGFRIGEVETVRGSGVYGDSSAHLGILRADVVVADRWSALVEGRVLASPSADTVDFGVLAAVYRSFGDNMRVGVGYNFGRFSDDLTDLVHDDEGVFLNIVGKL